MSQLFVPPTDFDQTKRIRRHQWCVDGAHALSWVLPTPQAERFAKAAGYHGARNRGKSRRSTVETGTYPQKQKPLRQDPILVPLSRGYPPSSSSKSLGEAVFILFTSREGLRRAQGGGGWFSLQYIVSFPYNGSGNIIPSAS